MRKDKNLAIKLRKSGKSYEEIYKLTNIPKSTLSDWFSDIAWSKKTKESLSKIARKNASKRMTIISHKKREERKKHYKEKRNLSKKLFEKFKKENLFIAGLMLYWGEGDSKLTNGAIRIANSDPLMLKLFYKFLKVYLIEISKKAKIYLILYPDLNDKQCKEIWSKKVGISTDKFFKSTIIKGRCPTKRLSYGIGNLIIVNRAYKEIIINWVKLIKKENIMRV